MLWKMLSHSRSFCVRFGDSSFFGKDWTFSGKLAGLDFGILCRLNLVYNSRMSLKNYRDSSLISSILPPDCSNVILTFSPCFSTVAEEYKWTLELLGKSFIKATYNIFHSPTTSPLTCSMILDPLLPNKFSIFYVEVN